jgi:hypothetical protein
MNSEASPALSRFTAALPALLLIQTIGLLVGAWFLVESLKRIALLERGLSASNVSVTALEKRVVASEVLLTSTLESRLSAALPGFVDKAASELGRKTIPSLRLRALSVVDAAGSERIQLGMGDSPFSGKPNAFIRVLSPNGVNPILITSTDDGASVSVDARTFISADAKGRGGLTVYRQAYKTGAKATATIAVSQEVAALSIRDSSDTERAFVGTGSGESSLILRNSTGSPAAALISKAQGTWVGVTGSDGQIRSGIANLPSGESGMFVNNTVGTAVYVVASTSSPYAESLLKENPSSQAWSAASTFSTLKTFWDIFIRR